jgi:hypothetical protein
MENFFNQPHLHCQIFGLKYDERGPKRKPVNFCSSGNNSWPSWVGDCFKVSDILLLGPVLKPVVTTDDSHLVWNYY